MKNIRTIHFKLLADPERCYLADRIVSVLEEVTEIQCKTTVQLREELKRNTINLQKAGERKRSHELTPTIAKADREREQARKFITGTIRLYLKSRTPKVKRAAENLKTLYTQAFSIVKTDNNTEESTGIDRFLSFSATEEAQEYISLLRLTEEMEQLRNSNDVFREASSIRAQEQYNDTTPRLKPARRDLNLTLNALESFFNFQLRLGSSFHESFVPSINGQIQSINVKAQARDTRNTKKAS